MTTNQRIETPWGQSQTVQIVAPGILNVSTPGHGGYLLDAERNAVVLAHFPEVKPWAGPAAYEEDCDWSYVAISFPQFFAPQTLYHAFETLKGYYTGQYIDTLEARNIAAAWYRENCERYTMGCASTGGHGWSIDFRRIDGADRIQRDGIEYPAEPNYTKEERPART